MMNKNISLLVAFAATSILVTSCMKEELSNNQSGAALNFRSVPSSISLTNYWVQGATDIQGAAATPRGQFSISVVNNFLGNGFAFQRANQVGSSNNFGRALGAKASHAFIDSGLNWKCDVPFAFGTNASNAEAIWTPAFTNAAPRATNVGLFVTDNASGDLDPATGVIQVGDFRAKQLQIVSGGVTRPRVSIEKKNGSTWTQIARTDGSNGLCNLESFTVVKVRTDFTISSNVMSAPTTTDVPVFKALNTANTFAGKSQLWTSHNPNVMNSSRLMLTIQ